MKGNTLPDPAHRAAFVVFGVQKSVRAAANGVGALAGPAHVAPAIVPPPPLLLLMALPPLLLMTSPMRPLLLLPLQLMMLVGITRSSWD